MGELVGNERLIIDACTITMACPPRISCRDSSIPAHQRVSKNNIWLYFLTRADARQFDLSRQIIHGVYRPQWSCTHLWSTSFRTNKLPHILSTEALLPYSPNPYSNLVHFRELFCWFTPARSGTNQSRRRRRKGHLRRRIRFRPYTGSPIQEQCCCICSSEEKEIYRWDLLIGQN